MPRIRAPSWYGVRTLVRLVASSQPKVRDKYFDPQSTLVEDRVVLFLADSGDEAIRQGEAEARRYCGATRFVNVYGQRVRLKYLRVAEAFSIVDMSPGSGCEVYSSTAIVPHSVSDSTVIKERFGDHAEQGARSRLKFLDAAIVREGLNRSTVPSGRRGKRS